MQSPHFEVIDDQRMHSSALYGEGADGESTDGKCPDGCCAQCECADCDGSDRGGTSGGSRTAQGGFVRRAVNIWNVSHRRLHLIHVVTPSFVENSNDSLQRRHGRESPL